MILLQSILLFTTLVFEVSSLIPIPMNGSMNERLELTVNSSIEYIINYDSTNKTNVPARVYIDSNDSERINPLFVVVQQKTEILSWQLPLVIEHSSGNSLYRRTARTLCYDNLNASAVEPPIVSISTSSKKNINVAVIVEYEENFHLNDSIDYNVIVSPGMSRIFYYNFPLKQENKYGNNVVLVMESEDTICMTVSIQNASCPVYDQNHDVKFEGFWETIDVKGGITIPRSKFPHGFFLVLVVMGNDLECSPENVAENVALFGRNKNVTFILKPGVSYEKYTNAVVATLACIGVFYLIFGISFFFCSRRNYVPRTMDYVQQCDEVQEEISSISGESRVVSGYSNSQLMTSAEVRFQIDRPTEMIYLNQLICSPLLVLKTKSYTYLWQVLTVAVFYGLPVVQLVITYQRVLQDTGNQDLCYYNFLCAHPLGLLSDFNHVFSNIGYLLLGFLFLWITRRRECWHQDGKFDEAYGIPPHYGMFYAMGVALCMEGVLSGSYHVCPNQSNFQFDTSFMYVIAVLCMVKIYQTRHPDVNATANATFGVLAIAILLGMVGILEANIYFWSFFTVLHLVVCWYLSAQVYYIGSWSFQPVRIMNGVFSSIFEHGRSVQGFVWLVTPSYKRRFLLLLIGNIVNWLLAGFGIYRHDKDFALHLFTVFMCNTLLYFVFYVIMKIVHKERINKLAWTFLSLSLLCAVAAMYFFLNKSISWALTPAGSRHFNRECDMLQFYDYHDIWHFLSAVGMFFMFMMLLLLDDDLSHTHRSKIPVF